MVRAKWWPLAGTKIGHKKPRRSAKRGREAFLGPEIVLSGELTCCDTLVVEGIVDSGRIECRRFVLGNAGSCKGEVQAESAVIDGRFEGRLIISARLLIKSGGQVRGSVQYGQLEIEPGGQLQGDMVVHPASNLTTHVDRRNLWLARFRHRPRSFYKGRRPVGFENEALCVHFGSDGEAVEAYQSIMDSPGANLDSVRN